MGGGWGSAPPQWDAAQLAREQALRLYNQQMQQAQRHPQQQPHMRNGNIVAPQDLGKRLHLLCTLCSIVEGGISWGAQHIICVFPGHSILRRQEQTGAKRGGCCVKSWQSCHSLSPLDLPWFPNLQPVSQSHCSQPASSRLCDLTIVQVLTITLTE